MNVNEVTVFVAAMSALILIIFTRQLLWITKKIRVVIEN